MKSTWLKFAIPFMPVLMSILLLAACASDEKVGVAEQTWECMSNAGDPEIFETSMLMTFPTASNLEEAKEQFIYASSAASLEELKAGRDEACGGDAPEPTPTTTVPQQTEGPRPTVTAASVAAPTLEPTATPASRSTASYEPDRLVLVALYHATDGPNWENNENWLSGAPIGEWYGVTTDDNGRVKWLHLFRNGLSGEIPPELGSLASLEEMIISGNQLSGCVPANLQDQLGEVVGEPFCASAPETDREPLVALYNATDGPNWANNEDWLSGAPIGEWYGVTTDNNGRVTWLWLDGNQLSGEIPPELGSLSNLENLDLAQNRLSGEIPPELGSLSNLESLELTQNRLSGEIPPELGNLANLAEMYLWVNQLSGEIPPELGNLANLTQMALSANELSGEIPPELSSLSNLGELRLNNNELSGDIPSELGQLSNLESLVLSNNELRGCVPSSLQDRLIVAFSDLGGLPFCDG